MADVNMQHKDTVFRILFSDKEKLLELYNAVNGSHYTGTDELEINTLQNAVYLNVKNDISFIIHSEINFQSRKDIIRYKP